MADIEPPADPTPLGDAFHLPEVISGLADDLRSLRAGKISVQDATARAALAKQIFNGVRLVINANRLLVENARQIEQRREEET